MVHDMAISVASFFVRKQYISDKLYDWCVYAVERRIQKALVFIAILLIGAFTHTVGESLIFYVGFILFRKRMGGYHASSPAKCLIISVLLIQAGVKFLQPILEPYAYIWGSCFGIVVIAVVLLVRPANHPNMHMTPEEVQANWARARVTLVPLTALLTAGLFWAPSAHWAFSGLISVTMAAFMLAFAKCIGQEVKENGRQKDPGPDGQGG